MDIDRTWLSTLTLASTELPNGNAIFHNLLAWLLGIISSASALFFLIDMCRHIFSNRRDLVAAGKDGMMLAVLLGLASQSENIITTLKNWIVP